MGITKEQFRDAISQVKTFILGKTSNMVPKTRTINGKALSEDITLKASDIGAEASGTAANQITSHNISTSAHNDIRLLITGLTDRLNTLANSDDTTLDQMKEVVAYIKANRELIESITTTKVSVDSIINNLETNVSDQPLSAAQGVVLKSLIDALQTALNNKPDNDTKNTAGATDTSVKLFLIGATEQSANPQTYSHDTVYIGEDGCLYVNGKKVIFANSMHKDSYIHLQGEGGISVFFSAYDSTNKQGTYVYPAQIDTPAINAQKVNGGIPFTSKGGTINMDSYLNLLTDGPINTLFRFATEDNSYEGYISPAEWRVPNLVVGDNYVACNTGTITLDSSPITIGSINIDYVDMGSAVLLNFSGTFETVGKTKVSLAVSHNIIKSTYYQCTSTLFQVDDAGTQHFGYIALNSTGFTLYLHNVSETDLEVYGTILLRKK